MQGEEPGNEASDHPLEPLFIMHPKLYHHNTFCVVKLLPICCARNFGTSRKGANYKENVMAMSFESSIHRLAGARGVVDCTFSDKSGLTPLAHYLKPFGNTCSMVKTINSEENGTNRVASLHEQRNNKKRN